MDIELVRRAREFAIEAHCSQTRKFPKDGSVPYWHHLRRVAQIIIRYNGDDEMIAAAWLHDTIEDTVVTYQAVKEHFGEGVADLVLEVTNVSRGEHGKRPIRKRLDRQYLAGASWRGQMLKLADTIDNLSTIAECDLGFAKLFVAEKAELVPVLAAARMVCFPLWDEAMKTVQAAQEAIKRRTGDARAA
ncbi:HD domain-containing protein [Bradyrhizobium sp. SZCCHNR3118]|uniref:HD domain-containing protein n=1 Tax=Bradyrhizobium sp. SZCCHNR3118 TaxID=3057468 RepID=UPI00291638DB|nr:HD domain-containing protein [Bradyrhizobium sp. SZCCHNR3118]